MPSSPIAAVEILGIEAGGRGAALGRERRDAGARPARGAARQLLDAAAGRGRPDPGDPFDLCGPGLPGRRSRACAAAPIGRVRYESAQRRGGAGGAARVLRARGHPAGAGERARAGRRAPLGRRASRQAGCWSACPAAATRTCRRCRRRWVRRGERQAAGAHGGRRRRAGPARASRRRCEPPRTRGQPALVAYLTAGFPSRERFREICWRGCRGRRCGGDRRAVLRSHGRWRDYPARQRAGAAQRA